MSACLPAFVLGWQFYLSVYQSACLSLTVKCLSADLSPLPHPPHTHPHHCLLFFLFFKKKKKGFNEDFHKQVPSVFAVISFFLFHSHHLIFTGIVFILNLKHSWESVGCSNITPPTSTAARWCTHTYTYRRAPDGVQSTECFRERLKSII